MADPRVCPKCGQPLATGALEGACSVCLLRRGLDPASDLPDLDDSGRFDVSFGLEPTNVGHVIEVLGRSIGPIPRLLLPDTAQDDRGIPVIKPSSPEMPAPSGRSERYQLFGEIARGGMGAVLKGRDTDLGRDLAVKVLLESHEDNPEMLRRFVEEAQIGGQLQHPGIVPVYELGTFADRRPYFSMKLVKGRTMAALLQERTNPRAELPRFLSIFEAVCQTVAYAHARGVIHRDLKPSNVMVGSFGEVQVMDLGLAKVLKEGGVRDEPPEMPRPEASVIDTVRSGSDVEDSHAGTLMGTPAYMAPEQADGQIERVNRRADVFGLGAILCEILTGQPAFTGRTQAEVVRKAMRGDLAEAVAALDACGAEPELTALARDCLAAEPQDRPHDAGVVAGRVTAFLAGVQERLLTAERERAVAEARAVEERRRRKLQLGLAASLLTLTTAGGLGTTYYLQQRQAHAAAVDQVLARASLLRDQAQQHADNQARWQVTLAAIDQAESVLRGDDLAQSRLAALSDEVKAGARAAEADRKLIDRIIDIRSARTDDPDGSATDADYADAFREADLHLAALPTAEAAARIKSRPPAVATALVAALDDWADVRRTVRRNRVGARRLSEIASGADPDPWRKDLRAALDQPDRAARLATLKDLAGKAKHDELGPVSLDLLGLALDAAGDCAAAETVLRSAQRWHPADVWVYYDLAGVLDKLSRTDEAVRYYVAARSLRPETAHKLAHVLQARGESDEAIEVFRQLCRIRSRNGFHLGCFGAALKSRGRSEEARKVLETAIAVLGEEIQRHPRLAWAHLVLGKALQYLDRVDEAVNEYRLATNLKADDYAAHNNLGEALHIQGKLDEAITELRLAVKLQPDKIEAHYNLGRALSDRGRVEEAVNEYRLAIKLKPEDPESHCNLGTILRGLGDFAGSVDELRKGHELGSRRPDWVYPSAQWLADAEKLASIADRIPRILRGEDQPADAAEGLAVAQLCYEKGLHANATRLFRGALNLDPKRASNRRTQPRYNAACAAVLAGSGKSKDVPLPDDTTRRKLRDQAREWLAAELADWTTFLQAGGSEARAAAVPIFQHWKVDADLAGIRDQETLTKLSDEERQAWRALWADVDTLLKKAKSP
jgi:serine/threonine-protein kinase